MGVKMSCAANQSSEECYRSDDHRARQQNLLNKTWTQKCHSGAQRLERSNIQPPIGIRLAGQVEILLNGGLRHQMTGTG